MEGWVLKIRTFIFNHKSTASCNKTQRIKGRLGLSKWFHDQLSKLNMLSRKPKSRLIEVYKCPVRKITLERVSWGSTCINLPNNKDILSKESFPCFCFCIQPIFSIKCIWVHIMLNTKDLFFHFFISFGSF